MVPVLTCGGHGCDDPLGGVSLGVHAVLGGARLHQGRGGEGADQDQGGQHREGGAAGNGTTAGGDGTAAGDGTAGGALVPPTHCSAVAWPCQSPASTTNQSCTTTSTTHPLLPRPEEDDLQTHVHDDICVLGF